MTAPQKPWEKAGVNSQNQSSNIPSPMSSLPSGELAQSRGNLPPCCRPPNVPSRTTQGSALGSSYGGYGGGYGSYGSSLYSPYGGGMGGMYGGGMYGGYAGGGYGSGGYAGGMYNRPGETNGNYNTDSFVQQAELSSRQAFQSVESVVQAFGSIAMMLDSTYYAVYNSFRAILGVADQFSRVKTHLSQVLSALAVFKMLRWLWRNLLVLLRLREAGLPEDVWAKAAEEGVKAVLSEQDIKGAGGGASSWPILLFFAIIFGGPWLLWKILSKVNGVSRKDWASEADEHYIAAAEYDFISDAPDELSFKKGQRLVVAPKELQPKIRGWLLASVDGKKTGVIPANYVKIMGRKNGTRSVIHPVSKGSCCSQQKGDTQLVKVGNSSNASDLNASVVPSKSEGINQDVASSFENSFSGVDSEVLKPSKGGDVIKGVEEQSAFEILDKMNFKKSPQD